MAAEAIYILESNDGKAFDVGKKIIAQSVVLSEMMELVNDSETKTIPLTISSVLLKPIIDYCTLYQDVDEAYVVKNPPPIFLTEKDSEFMKDISNDILEDLTNAANYLNIPRLIDACLLHLRDQMRLSKIKNKQTTTNLTYEEQQSLYEKYVIWS
uniref:SKP1 component POZ domain-containing protein n=1 Tax=Panagrolaimus superbus TaxID=310955 RepID=A0A914ZBA2_9BILA